VVQASEVLLASVINSLWLLFARDFLEQTWVRSLTFLVDFSTQQKPLGVCNRLIKMLYILICNSSQRRGAIYVSEMLTTMSPVLLVVLIAG